MERLVSTKALRPFIYGVIPAFIASHFIYLIFTIPKDTSELGELPGRSLASYPDLYPVVPSQNGNMVLDTSICMDVVKYFLENENPKAAIDLLYLGQSNNINYLLSND